MTNQLKILQRIGCLVKPVFLVKGGCSRFGGKGMIAEVGRCYGLGFPKIGGFTMLRKNINTSHEFTPLFRFEEAGAPVKTLTLSLYITQIDSFVEKYNWNTFIFVKNIKTYRNVCNII